MQTFLPFPSFIKSAACLDNRRLGKQIVEARQIYDIISNAPACRATKSQRNHPIIATWRDFLGDDCLPMLASYITALSDEYYVRFGWHHQSAAGIESTGYDEVSFPAVFHVAHRCALRAKDPAYYTQSYQLGPGTFNAHWINYLWYNSKIGWFTGTKSRGDIHILPDHPDVFHWINDCDVRNLIR